MLLNERCNNIITIILKRQIYTNWAILSLISNLQLTKKLLSFLFQEGCVFAFHSLASCCSSLLMRLKGESNAKIWWPWEIIMTKYSGLFFASFCFLFFLSFCYFQLSPTRFAVAHSQVHSRKKWTKRSGQSHMRVLPVIPRHKNFAMLRKSNTKAKSALLRFELMSNIFNTFVKRKKSTKEK